MDRRDFIKILASGLLYFAERRAFPSVLKTRFEVSRVKSRDTERAVIKAIDMVGGINRFVKPGDIVVVKPNIGWNRPPYLKADTDPLIVRTIVHLCFQALASKVYVFDRTCDNPRLAYRNSGIEKAAREAGARVLPVNSVNSKLYKKIAIPQGRFLKESLINRYILESDVFIDVPVAKNHSSATLTLGMKNLMGITGDNRQKWHWKLHEAISDINTRIKPDLTVIDATKIMLKNGPTGGSTSYLKEMDTVIASSNVLSADSEAAKLFGLSADKIPYMKLGAEKGVGKISGYTLGSINL